MRAIGRSPLLHPLMFATFPLVFLWSQNLREDIGPGKVLPLLAATLGVTAAVFAAARLALRDPARAGLVTSVLVALALSFGHVERVAGAEIVHRRELALLALWGVLLILGVGVAVRTRRAERITGGLNLVAGILVVMNVVPIVRFEVAGASPVAPARLELPGVDPDAIVERPDVYYLVFDRYAGEGTLRDLYGYDNGPQIRWLEQQGFYVVPDAVANYALTTHSLASSLNMQHLQGLVEEVGDDSGDWGPIRERLQGFAVERAFQTLGYRSNHIGSWWTPTARDRGADRNFEYGFVQEFPSLYWQTTVFPDLGEFLGISDIKRFERTQYERVLYQIRTIQRIAEDPGPTFTFAHFTLPHEPYVFDRDGSYLPPEATDGVPYKRLYVDQLIYTNTAIREIVGTLLAGPDETDPIIVIQSDEGPHPYEYLLDQANFRWGEADDGDLGEKLRILNAIHLPGLDGSGLYPTITPVNTFRVIFNRYFGGELPLLEDRTYVHEGYYHPYRLTEVTDRLRT